MPDPVGIPIELGLDITRRAARAAHDAIVMEWAADVAARDAEIAELTERVAELIGEVHVTE